MYFIGVDNGATRTRTVVLNLETASLVAHSEKEYGLVAGLPSGHCEQDPSLWIRAVDHTVRDCLAQLGEGRRRVAGMGVSGQVHGLVGLDADNRIVRPAKLEADRSAAPQCAELSRDFGGAPGLIELCGNPLRPTQMAPRISWIRQNEPYHFQRVAIFLSPHDFINYWLSGVKGTEYAEASQSGLLDVRARTWRRELVDHLDPRLGEMLPPVRSSCEPLGVLRAELARAWGLSEELLLSAGGPSDAMTVLGTGAATPGALSVSMDSPATLGGVSAEPVIDDHGEVAACCDATDHWLPLLKCPAASAGAQRLPAHYGWDVVKLENALATTEPGAQGLTFLPGRPRDSLLDRGALLGMDERNVTPANVARAGVEALAFELARGLRRMRQLGFAPDEVRLSGRLAGLPPCRQLLADVLGVPILSAKRRDCAGLGAALQAAVTFFRQSGEDLTYAEMTSYAVLPEEQTLCAPDRQRTELYRELMERHEQLREFFQEGPLC